MGGVVTIEKRYLDGRVEVAVEGECNRIMQITKARFISALTSQDTGNSNLVDPVVELRFGSGGVSGGNPIKLTGIEETLFNPIVSGYTPGDVYQNRNTADLSHRTVSYGFVLPAAQLGGEVINEMGLFTASGKLAAMKTFDDVPKDNTFDFVVTWRISLV